MCHIFGPPCVSDLYRKFVCHTLLHCVKFLPTPLPQTAPTNKVRLVCLLPDAVHGKKFV